MRSSVSLIVLFGVFASHALDSASFRNPDRSCRPETWFHLIGGNVSKKGETVVLDLGDVEFVADVFVNGRKVRTFWSHPYRCEIGGFVKDGENELRIDVTSTWFNRLAYDAALPEKDLKTWTISAPPKGTLPLPAGLLGPVILRR